MMIRDFCSVVETDMVPMGTIIVMTRRPHSEASQDLKEAWERAVGIIQAIATDEKEIPSP